MLKKKSFIVVCSLFVVALLLAACPAPASDGSGGSGGQWTVAERWPMPARLRSVLSLT